ncbi:MAG: reverse transcriptase domain-containing protein [Candidatus Marinimicrobia bacterium]|jgi:retron-type reverse transcriptase|nr:reverse transcriptase domain-containing protein [Candidatus Neomarinimicrobiota bacterium]|tara:strand:- start:859 stop:1908 length:1050 start_codon:yes stop_codon:yes gene_type:complete
MKRVNHLYKEICTFENLFEASRKARLGKRLQVNVANHEYHLEKELFQLQQELKTKTYQPGPYKEFYIVEPKKRMISAAPYRDRVVHHALCNIIEPIFDKTFIYDSYANRKEKGTHRAILRYQHFSRKYPFVLKCDVKKYFPSIDHTILKSMIRRKIKCKETLWLIDLILENSNLQETVMMYFPDDDLFTPLERRKGLPIGNLTSQFFANIYLNKFDHFVKEKLRRKGYVRYVDDFVIFGNDKDQLWADFNNIMEQMETLRLKLHQKKSMVYRVKKGVIFLGHKIFPEFKLLRQENVISFRRKLKKMNKAYTKGRISRDQVTASVKGWVAHASFSNTYRLRKKVLAGFVF